MPTSTHTHLDLLSLPDRSALRQAFIGQPLSALRSPALIVDRKVFVDNCERVTNATAAKGLRFRAHVKTHKTIEGTRIQAQAGDGVKAMIASTMVEMWQLVESGLVEEGLVDDILYSMPVSEDKLEDLRELQDRVKGKAVIRLMVDHSDQIDAIGRLEKGTGQGGKWSVFIKVDGGGRRAGAPPNSQQMKNLITSCLSSPSVEIFGFYSHFGQSYASKDLHAAEGYFNGEVECVNAAARVARGMGAEGKWVLSVGATPTAHAATMLGEVAFSDLEGELELHAGCYCMLDLQQLATSLVPPSALALTVLTRVVSVYPHRSEAACDAGALAMSKDPGPLAGFGQVISPDHLAGWDLGRVSQEHGILVHRSESESVGEIRYGDLLRIVPQHACLTCAGHPWIYVIEDGGDKVVDVWVPWKGW